MITNLGFFMLFFWSHKAIINFFHFLKRKKNWLWILLMCLLKLTRSRSCKIFGWSEPEPPKIERLRNSAFQARCWFNDPTDFYLHAGKRYQPTCCRFPLNSYFFLIMVILTNLLNCFHMMNLGEINHTFLSSYANDCAQTCFFITNALKNFKTCIHFTPQSL